MELGENMPNQNKKSMHRVPFYRRPIVIILCLIMIIAIAVAVVLAVKLVSGDKEQTGETTTKEPESGLVYRESDDEDEENDLPPEDQKVITQYEGGNPNELDHLTGLITYTEIKDDSLIAMVSIDQYLSSGICMASLKSGDQAVISVEQAIEADASTSHCGPIGISLANVSGGKYQLEVVISSGGKTGVVTSNVEF